MTDAEKIANALTIAADLGGFEGDHHRVYCIDQMVQWLMANMPSTINVPDNIRELDRP